MWFSFRSSQQRSPTCLLQVILLFDLPIDTSKSSSSGKQQQIYCYFFSFESVDTPTFFLLLLRRRLSFVSVFHSLDERAKVGVMTMTFLSFFLLLLLLLLLNVIHIVYFYAGRTMQNTTVLHLKIKRERKKTIHIVVSRNRRFLSADLKLLVDYVRRLNRNLFSIGLWTMKFFPFLSSFAIIYPFSFSFIVMRTHLVRTRSLPR